MICIDRDMDKAFILPVVVAVLDTAVMAVVNVTVVVGAVVVVDINVVVVVGR